MKNEKVKKENPKIDLDSVKERVAKLFAAPNNLSRPELKEELIENKLLNGIHDYKKEMKAWDESLTRQLKLVSTYKIVTILSLIVAFVSWLVALNNAYKPKFKAYVVKTDSTGNINYGGIINPNANIVLTDAMIKKSLIDFVSNLRTVPTDPIILKNNLNNLSSFLAPSAVPKFTDSINLDKPYTLLTNNIRREVKIDLAVKQSTWQWQVQWIEELRFNGLLQQSVRKAGTFHFTQGSVDSEAKAIKNPLGFFVDDFSIADYELKDIKEQKGQ